MYSTKADELFHSAAAKADLLDLPQNRRKFGSWLYICGTKEIWWSDEVYELFGANRNTPVNCDFFLKKVHQKDRDMVRNRIDQISALKFSALSYRIIVEKKVKWVEMLAYFHPQEGDISSIIIGIIRDITVQKAKRLQKDPHFQDLAVLQNYMEETAAITALQEVVKNAKNNLQTILNTDLSTVFMNRGGALANVLESGNAHDTFFKFLLFRSSSVHQCMNTGETTLLKRQGSGNPQEQAVLKELDAQLIVNLPIKTYHETIAVLSLVFKNTMELSEQQLAVCEIFCNYLSVQLQNTFLFEQYRQEESHRKIVESDLDTFLTAGIDFIAVIKPDGYFEKVNPSMVRRFGYSYEELLKKPFNEFFHPDDRENFKLSDIKPEDGILKSYRNRVVCKNGDVVDLEWNAVYLRSSDRIIAISKDITDQERIRAANLELEKSVALEKMKMEFFAQLSHEFKTPLNIILSSLQLLKIKLKNTDTIQFDKEYEKFFGYMEQNSYKLLRLASNLIDLTRASNDFLELTLENCNMQILLTELVASVETYAFARGIRLKFSSKTKDSAYVFCDKDKIERIVLNLLSNAIKNTGSGGKIEVILDSDKSCLKIAVKDTGVGIEPTVLPYIFDKFRVSNKGFVKNCDGSGIGLSIVKSLVEAHKGIIAVSSTPGSGSIFEFTISRFLKQDPADNLLFKNRGNIEARLGRILMEMSDLPSRI